MGIKKEIKYMNINDVKPYKDNPRHNTDEAIEKVKESISKFNFQNPIIVDKNNEIVAGHTRRLAAIDLGMETVPVIIADDLTDEQVRAFRLADNKVAEFSEWDMELLQSELNMLEDIDMDDFGFEDELANLDDEDEYEEGENPYTLNVDSPVYEIQGDKPNLDDLYSTEKAEKLQKSIKEANIPNDVKDFLIKATYRHIEFNYKYIAEYYAHAPKEVQQLMEDSALIIIDYNKAIEDGYVKITEGIGEVAERDDV